MSESPAGELDARFSDPDATPTAWASARAVLDDARIAWIATTRRDGRPHVTPVVFVWSDDAPHFCTGPDEQKHRNLEGNKQVAVTTGSTGAQGWAAGKDVVVEGTAVRITDAETLQRLADAWFAKYADDWHYAVRGEEFVELDQSGGGAHGGAWVYRVEPAKVMVFGDDHGQTTYRP